MFPNDQVNAKESKVLTLRQTSFGCGRLGANIWPSAIALSCLLAGDSGDLIEGKRVLEVGAGCGLPSAYCSWVAHSILATDYWEEKEESSSAEMSPSYHDSLYRNSAIGETTNTGDRLVAKNLFGVNLAYNIGQSEEHDNTSVKRLDWHDEMGIHKIADDFRPDVIIGSDLVYYPMDTTPLFQTLEILLKTGGAEDVLLMLPLPPMADREALPDFRRRLDNGEMGDDCEVIIDELEMVGRGDNDGEERHKFLRVQIHYNAPPGQ